MVYVTDKERQFQGRYFKSKLKGSWEKYMIENALW